MSIVILKNGSNYLLSKAHFQYRISNSKGLARNSTVYLCGKRCCIVMHEGKGRSVAQHLENQMAYHSGLLSDNLYRLIT